jgi:tripartite-type tricarboxylate transporter receptor subunit TctC
MIRRLLVCAAITAALCGPAAAQTYPTKPIRFIVNTSAGATIDITARILATYLSAKLKQQVIVENKDGAQNLLGAQAVASAPPDGYTLLVSSSSLPTFPAVMKDPQLDPLTDFEFISLLRKTPLTLVATAQKPFKSFGDLITYAKANPGKLNFGTFGSSIYILASVLNKSAGIDAVNVPYRGLSQARAALATGEVDYLLESMTLDNPLVADGKVRIIAVAARQRMAEMPSVPSVTESGIGLESDLTTWVGWLAPKGTPEQIVRFLSAQAAEFARDPATIERFRALGFQPIGSTPEEFRDLVKREKAMYIETAAALGIAKE